MRWAVVLQHRGFVKRLAEIYGVKAVVVRDGLNVRRFLQFPSMLAPAEDTPLLPESPHSTVDDWCRDHLVVTGVKLDCVVLGELKASYREGVTSSLIKAFYADVPGVTFAAKTTLRGSRETKRDVLRGVKLLSAPRDVHE